jgi:hypothetical protein
MLHPPALKGSAAAQFHLRHHRQQQEQQEQLVQQRRRRWTPMPIMTSQMVRTVAAHRVQAAGERKNSV